MNLVNLATAHGKSRCQHCGGPMLRALEGRGRPYIYCSDGCRKAASYAAVRQRNQASRKSASCRLCGRDIRATHPNWVFCSAEHRLEWNNSRLKQQYAPSVKVKTCTRCGKTFETGVGRGCSKKFCGSYCRKASWWKEAHTRYGTDGRSRARKRGLAREHVDWRRVMERDGWTCQVCGRSTPKSRRGTRHANAPELDHRVPIAAGGSHTYDNVQCACRRCNQLKGANRVVGQLPLLGPGGRGA